MKREAREREPFTLNEQRGVDALLAARDEGESLDRWTLKQITGLVHIDSLIRKMKAHRFAVGETADGLIEIEPPGAGLGRDDGSSGTVEPSGVERRAVEPHSGSPSLSADRLWDEAPSAYRDEAA